MTRPIYTTHIVDLIQRMQQGGSTNREIAKEIGTTPERLQSRMSQLGLTRNRTVKLDAITVRIPAPVALRYYDAAFVRDLPVQRLARLLLVRIARDNLFTAVLDDGK